MTPTLLQLLALQCAMLLAIHLLFFRRIDVPFSLKIILLVVYVTVPLALLVKGIQSAVYVSDLLLPVLLFSALVSPQGLPPSRRWLVTSLFLLIVILPVVLALCQVVLGDLRGGLGSRNVKGDIIWLYRNLTYVLVLRYGLSLNLTASQILAFIRMNIALAGVLALLGFANYFGPFNLAIFEDLAWKEWVQESFRENRVGLGFMGLFRASVGQWFAMIALLSAGTYAVMPRRYRLLSALVMGASIGMILLSHSRAGLVGLGMGFVLLSLLANGWVPKAMAVLGVCGTFVWILLRQDVLANRAVSIFSGTQNAFDRVRAWEKAYDFFSQHANALLFGVGPANRETVFKVIGEYGAHNEYIDVLFRLGFFGLVGLIAILVVLLATLMAARNRFGPEGHAVLTTTAVLVIANCVMGMTQEHLLHDYASYTMGVYIYLLYGVILGIESPSEMEESMSEANQELEWGSHAGYVAVSTQR